MIKLKEIYNSYTEKRKIKDITISYKQKLEKEKAYKYFLKRLYKIISSNLKRGKTNFYISWFEFPLFWPIKYTEYHLEGCYNALITLVKENPQIFEGLYFRRNWILNSYDSYTSKIRESLQLCFCLDPENDMDYINELEKGPLISVLSGKYM